LQADQRARDGGSDVGSVLTDDVLTSNGMASAATPTIKAMPNSVILIAPILQA
jgi:hypothetical protein